MGIACGSQAVLCEYPIRFDTYKGCSHGCRYCFAQTKVNLSEIKLDNCIQQLSNFINGRRSRETNWCDWDIPLHWGGLSDPFQPAEREGGISLKCLELFRATQYPVIISTKGVLITEEPYLSVLRDCNAVVQVSMVGSQYDVMEPGAPTFEQRLAMVEKLSENSKRVIVRAQPYLTTVHGEFLENIPRIKEAGAYGVTVEGMKFKKGKPGLVKEGGDWCYPQDLLESRYRQIRKACHEVGLKFFCAENRLRPMGDSYACCGCGDLDGFEGNPYNVVSLMNGREVEPTEKMRETGTATCFKALHQDAVSGKAISKGSFSDWMLRELESWEQRKVVRAHTEQEVLVFTRWLKSTGIRAKECNELTNTMMASHWLCTTQGGQSSIPTPEMFDKLRKSPKLREVPSFIRRLVYG